MIQIFGEFLHQFPPDHDSLELTFTPTSRPIKQRWRNNRLSAHFVADYFSSFLPLDADNPSREKRIQEGKGAVSYVANELLENAMKFNDESVKSKIKFGIHFIEAEHTVTAAIFATNSINLEGAKKFQDFIQELLHQDPNELYFHQVERSVEDDSDNTSGLGLLTMINDYQAQLGWKFESISNQVTLVLVTTMAQVTV
ncbi:MULTISPECIES: DUF6272 family protein [Planktothrix]|jgi:hypothetical protein|uniref:ATP-binding protein n=2 Tax=Planktothrix TaxID=54304 RepID=A0A4V0XU70_PLAAG|nr:MULTISPECIES: DUF6272 family protein [Planktothrix]CAD5965370.1 hypothetical protein NO108_03806 [Planktothrix rubescens]CAC5343296.1 conserved hypothetical protein [Planktothrix rubescens NIVA-CYA 18]CAD0229722.1 conserved hypothetical protein [Planktothrix agardhii]CAD5978381.1 hypothetical protein PCC7821_04344 [Planktothrix rubescens NIVA-CYA 18]CAD5981657.1 hypothetical protein NO758_04762 [Planktothrix agardhii]